MSDVQYHTMSDGRRIAFRVTRAVDAAGPALVFMPGYMSDMDGSKATSLFDAAKQAGRGCLLLDYSGCGQSSGKFADGTFARWLEEVLALIEAYTNGPILLVGSSMGGWLMLLVAEALGDRLAGMIGIAAAPDFTVWGYSDEQRAAMEAGQIVYEDNPYGPEPTPTHPGFFADAQAKLRLDRAIPIMCPVRLLHSRCDADVPYTVSLQLAEAFDTDDVQVTLLWDGDHRLSRDTDIALLHRVVSEFYD